MAVRGEKASNGVTELFHQSLQSVNVIEVAPFLKVVVQKDAREEEDTNTYLPIR